MTWDKDSQRRLSTERGTIFKDWGGRIPVALIYPNSYYIGMSNLGFQTVYGLFNSYDDIVCERVFCEGEKRSVESGRPLDDFACLAFSISSELDYFNVVDVLLASGTPLLAADRDDSHPLVIGGGPCITANPMPLLPLFDCFAIGEGEAIIPSIVKAFQEEAQMDRVNLLNKLSQIPGVYVPLLRDDRPIARQWVKDIDGFATASVILTPETEFGDMYLLEIGRGCCWGCRFCLAGFLTRPPRFRSLDVLLLQAEHGLQYSKRIGLLSASVSDHPEIDQLVPRLRRLGADISVSSLRIRPLSEVLLQGIAESGTATITLAPEAGSERLRRIINKGVSERDITAAVDKVGVQGFRNLKLYFMIGLPTETAEDIDELIKLVLNIKGRLDRMQSGTHVILTVEPFVPKAGTPFQRLPMAGVKTLRYRLVRIRSSLEPKGIEVRGESISWSVVQAVLSRGDARLAKALVRTAETAGVGGKSNKSLSAWRLALAELSIDADKYISRRVPVTERLPWHNLDSGVDEGYLEQELEKALLSEESPPCPSIECHKCGVC